MGNSTEPERAEFEQMRAAFKLEMIDNHYYTPSDFCDAGLQSDGSFVDDDLNEAAVIWDAAWQAARRAPVVQPDQLKPDAAKRAMEALQTEVDTLRSALAECRDAFPVPAPGSPIEPAWMQAMGHAEAVPDYMRAIAAVPLQLPLPKSAAALSDFAKDVYTKALAAGDVTPEGRMAFIAGAAWAAQELEAVVTASQAKTTTNADSASASGS